MDTIETAVILTAGNGTRRLPITRVIEKVMLPVGNRPTVDYAVEQCLAAGIRRLVFIVSRDDSQVRQYYGDTIDVAAEYPWLEQAGTIKVMYVVQRPEYGYGSGSGLKSAREALASVARFVVIAGDAFLACQTNPVAGLLAGCGDAEGALVGLEVPASDVRHYGILTARGGYLRDLQEKPESLAKGQLPLANVSYYVLSQAIFGLLDEVRQTGGEYYLTDAVLALAVRQKVAVVPVVGRYLDSGQVDKWLAANQYVLDSQHP
jgi:UTP--glucose-1-phosphate uridylyltransferase